ncbi:hypothetical protein LguiA_012812 [Lonicera macranthoides]
MPFISEAASAIKSRFGFHERRNSSESSPDLLKSSSKANSHHRVHSLDLQSVGDKEDRVDSLNRSFEFNEDPSFWNDHNVQVIIRLRPLSSSEISLQGHSRCVRQDSSQSITWTGHPESRFTFDLVADDTVTQEMLFKVSGVPMVENCMGGYNSCMFAYGQTGSGKTHTMLGDIEGGTRRHSVNCGMTPRVFEYLFSRIQKEREARREEKIRYTCKCSFLEIYNEQILDLLDPSSLNLQIREDTKKGVYVDNLTEVEVTSARDVIQQLVQGSSNRKVAATNMNRASSRSHSVFTCIIESKWESQGVTHHRFARLNLVDLAGSERQKSSGAEGERLKEATNINKSLSTLGLVIMNLVNVSNGKTLHVPYRDSKLTFLLQDSLGGNAKTIIIANISPASCCSLETLSTLKFAQRAKFIKNHATVNEDASGDVLAMRMQIQQLKLRCTEDPSLATRVAPFLHVTRPRVLGNNPRENEREEDLGEREITCKEVSRLQNLANNGGAENHESDAWSVSIPESPGAFKWEGLHGSSFTPFTSNKRMSQKKDYDAALVGAFRREKDKDIALQALTAETQATMQLAKQREDEIQGLKMRLRFREAGIKRLEAVASGKISAETHLLKEKEEHLKELEVLRAQVNRNQDVTRFAMENLRLKEEIRRHVIITLKLKSFCEEGERERMNEQIMILENKLLEALDWKLMHESDPSLAQKRISELSMDGDLLASSKEPASPWRTSVSEENEFLRMQAIQNQSEMDALRKKLDFCIAEREELERHVNALITELEADRSSKAETKIPQIELPPLTSDNMPSISLNDQMELKTMVDAIAAASQREAEAHQTAIVLSKENDELRMKLKILIDDNNKLIELYERAVDENQNKNSSGAQNSQPDNTEDHRIHFAEFARKEEVGMKKEVENLEHQLMEMHEENEKLMVLYEKAMQERDEFKKILSSDGQKSVENKEEFNSSGGECLNLDESTIFAEEKSQEETKVSFEETGLFEVNVEDGYTQCSESPRTNDYLDLDESISFMESKCDMGTDYLEPNVEDRVKSAEVEGCKMEVKSLNDMNLVRMKLDEAQQMLLNSAQSISVLGSLERATIEFSNLLREVEEIEESIQVKQRECTSTKDLSSEMQARRVLTEKKLTALKYTLSSFCSSLGYFEQRKIQARARLNASLSHLSRKKDELARLEECKYEIAEAKRNTQHSEVELKNKIEDLKFKIEKENKKQESVKVLLAIDNVEKTETQKGWHLAGKATELLKSQEEKTKPQVEMKQATEKLGSIRREVEDLKKRQETVELKIRGVQTEIQKDSISVEEMEYKLQSIIKEREEVLEMRENGRVEFENLILEYHQHTFEAELKVEEVKVLEEELIKEMRRIEELKEDIANADKRKTKLLEGTMSETCFVSEKIKEELQNVRLSFLELKSLLGDNRH